MIFVTLDEQAHVLAEGSVKTVCYLDVPYGTDYTQEQPDDLCAECAEKSGLELPKGKAKSGGKA